MYYSHNAEGGQDKPEMFGGLFRAAHESLLEYEPDLQHTILDANFITDSATMVQLFKVASEVHHQGPRVTTELHLDLFVHVFHGKIFMKASRPPNGRFKTDATGQFVPPRFGFCDRMKKMDAQCFKRATTYKIRTTGDTVIPPYRILILDDNLVEVLFRPWLQLDCEASGDCNHGHLVSHAVPIVIQDYHGPLVSLAELGTKKAWSEILPRVCFAGCEAFCLVRFGADLSNGFWETAGESNIFPAASQSWRRHHSGELWSLANLLQWIHIKAQGYELTGGRDAQFRVQLKVTSFEQYRGSSIPVYNLVTERLNTGERLVSEKDVAMLWRWMTEPRWSFPPEEHWHSADSDYIPDHTPFHTPIDYPPPPYAN
jgi:hypothetical protein